MTDALKGAVRDGARFKFPDLDGAVIGAPGMHFSFQQIQHLWSQFVEYQLNYYPPYCELEKIVNLTTEACDPLDGRVDGVVSRTDLCKLHFNLNSTIGESYSCSETAEIPNFMPYIPAQNGTVTKEGVAVAKEILNGAQDNLGRRIYMSYQPTAQFQDAVTSYNETTGEYGPYVVKQSAQWVGVRLNLLTNVSASPASWVSPVTHSVIGSQLVSRGTMILSRPHGQIFPSGRRLEARSFTITVSRTLRFRLLVLSATTSPPEVLCTLISPTTRV